MKSIRRWTPLTALLIPLWIGCGAEADDAAVSAHQTEVAAAAESTSPGEGGPTLPVDREGLEFILPYSVGQGSAEEQDAYLDGLDDAGFAALVDNARITKFLDENLDPDRLRLLGAAIEALELFTRDNVAPFLSAAELELLDVRLASPPMPSSNVSGNQEEIEKSCSAWVWYGQYGFLCLPLLPCRTCKVYQRTCSWWDLRPTSWLNDCRY